uniref:Ig-like domain-containing protein n=1 Tax=Sparus aurata TaxID=8175 RepID=A0A671WZL8_SPAAU
PFWTEVRWTLSKCILLFLQSYQFECNVSDVAVTCSVSEECVLPCSFKPDSKETVEWFRQDELVYKFNSEEHFEHEKVAGRASIFPHLISHGNATLILRSCGLKDRGTYRCHVKTSTGEHNAKVIVKVEGEFGMRSHLTESDHSSEPVFKKSDVFKRVFLFVAVFCCVDSA